MVFGNKLISEGVKASIDWARFKAGALGCPHVPWKWTIVAAMLVSSLSNSLAATEPNSQPVQAPHTRSTIELRPQHDFFLPLDAEGGIRNIKVDTLRLLNKSIWRPNSEQLPVSADEAIDLAISALSANAPYLQKKFIFSFSLRHAFGDAAEDVWYYEIIFDGARRFPMPKEGSRNADVQRAIILMDGSVWTPQFEAWDDMKKRIRKRCTYSKSEFEWKVVGCEEPAPN